PAGGLPRARPIARSGFGILNVSAVAVRDLRVRGVRRIAVVDIDAHHGDGTQAIFWEEDVLVISLHEYGGRFFPGTGSADERGEGQGAGHTVNLPLARGAGDEAFLEALDGALRRVREYQPEILIVQFGTDGHMNDPFAHLGLSDRAYSRAAELCHAVAH